MIKKLIKFWPLITLLALTFILRIVKMEDLFYFTYDESVFAFVGRRLILWHHIPLIGGVTPFGVHVAPYFYWFFALTLGIGNLNPLFWGYVAASIAAATTFLIYLVGSTIESKKIGFLASIFWTFSFIANLYDRHFWGLYFGPIFSLIIIYCLYQIIKGREKFTYLLGISLALIIHADLSFYVFLLFSIVVWIIYKLPVKKSTIVALIFIGFSFLPIIIFDIRHNFANIKPALKFLESGKNTPGLNGQKLTDNALLFPRNFSRLIYAFSDNEVSKQYSYCQVFASEKFQKVPWIFIIISSISLLTFVYWCFIKSKNVGWQLIGGLVLLYFIAIQIYGTILRADIFEHYIVGSFAAFFLILAKIVSLLPRKLIIVFLAIFVCANIVKLARSQNTLSLKNKRLAIEYTMSEVKDEPFSLDSISTCWKLSGYRYLFTVYGREPVKSYVDPNFAYLYGTTAVWDNHPRTVAAIVAHDFVPETEEFYERYAILKSHEVNSSLFGALEVIILDNTTAWFDKPKDYPSKQK